MWFKILLNCDKSIWQGAPISILRDIKWIKTALHQNQGYLTVNLRLVTSPPTLAGTKIQNTNDGLEHFTAAAEQAQYVTNPATI